MLVGKRQRREEGEKEGERKGGSVVSVRDSSDYCPSMLVLVHGHNYYCVWIFCVGDPALVHSHYIALVLPWKQPITTLVTLCRLGSKVVKAILLCSVNEDGNVHYQTVQWAR